MNTSTNTPNPGLISYMTLRKAIGFLGILLPAFLLTGTFIFGNCFQIQDSISQYYYSIMGNVFVGTLSAIAIFLIAYQGYDSRDQIATNLAGLFALGVAFVPTSIVDSNVCKAVYLSYIPIRYVHYISAALLFITLAYISYCLFTKSTAPKMSDEKKMRNRIYRICGIVIISSITMIFLITLIPSLKSAINNYSITFCLEWIALIAFGYSWLIKGEMWWKDKG